MTGRGGGRLWLAGLIAVAGLSLLAFPPVTNAVYDHRVAALAQTFQQTAQGVGDTPESHEDLYQYLKAENEHLFHTGQAGMVDAFAYETTHIDLSEYGLADNLIGFIAIPSIGIELPIYLGANRENLKQGAVHLTQTSYPIGGDNTNTVIAAHRGSAVVMFRNIHKIAPGDHITITNFREQLTYRAIDHEIISPDQTEAITIRPGQDRLTLLSCDPIGSYHQRYVVYAERVA